MDDSKGWEPATLLTEAENDFASPRAISTRVVIASLRIDREPLGGIGSGSTCFVVQT